MSNKIKAALSSETFRSILSAVICALVGILVGFIILLIINAEHAPKAISVILKNFFYYRRPAVSALWRTLPAPTRRLFVRRNPAHFLPIVRIAARHPLQRRNH